MRAINRLPALLVMSALACWAAGVATAAEKELSAAECFTTAMQAGDADAVGACYAEDAIMWFPGGPLATGRAAIRDGFSGYLSGVSIKSAELTPMGEETVGDTKVSWGTYVLREVDKKTGVETELHGRYTDLSKQIDGRWVYTVDHASDDPSASAQ